MKRFRFKLQTLLDQRQAREDRLLVELGELRNEEAAEVTRLNNLHLELERAWASTATALRCNASAVEISRFDEYAKTMRDDIRVQELTLQAVRERVEAKRVELVEAMKERKVLEALRDKQEQAYILVQQRTEQNALDEMSSLRYARGM